MGALPRPDVPEGHVRSLFDGLHELHHRAGWPSLRIIAKDVGCSHTTVSAAFSEPRVPRWGLLELIVEALGGDPDLFHRLWLAASGSEMPPIPSTPSPPPGSPPRPVIPRQLPGDVAAFTGRTDELAELDRLFSQHGTAAPAVAISTVSGTAGVGKTALAVHWAHRVADQFPDGQLYINLRGYDPGTPLRAVEALEILLRDLGVEDLAGPSEPAERATRYRTLLANRRMLIVLDNAYSVEQIRDLLPGTSSCFVVVTSRETLPALVARHGAVRLNLDLLPAADAVALLRTLIGARVSDEPGHAVALARLCARLPLALRVAAEMAATRPKVTLEALVVELSNEPRRLDLLAAGDDEYTAVRTVFSWSCGHLSDDSAIMFRLLGVHPGRDIDADAAAALAGTARTAARRALAELARAHLVEEIQPGRYAMHDLLRAYAAEQAAEGDDAAHRAALTRLFDYYLGAASTAMDAAFPHITRPRRHPVRSGSPDLDAAGARAWLDGEWRNVLAVADAAAEHWPRHAIELSTTMAGYLDARAHYLEALTMHGRALEASRIAADPSGEAVAHNLLATARRRLGQYPAAVDHHNRALALHRSTGDRAGEAVALHGLGILQWRLGRYDEAYAQLRAALAIHRQVGDRAGEGTALYGLGTASRRLGRYLEAVEHHWESAAVFREIRDRAGEARALSNLGVVYLFLGRYQDALSHHERSLVIHRDLGDRTGEGVVLTNLGTTYERMAQLDAALDHHAQALAIYGETGYRVGQADGLRGLGVVLCRLGRHDEAIESLTRAVTISRDLGEADLETGALIDLGDALRAAGQPAMSGVHYEAALRLVERTGDRYEAARALAGSAQLMAGGAALARFRRSLTLYEELGVPEVGEVRALMRALHTATPSEKAPPNFGAPLA
jgi:tetratricopeptide (TPR) repeat protein